MNQSHCAPEGFLNYQVPLWKVSGLRYAVSPTSQDRHPVSNHARGPSGRVRVVGGAQPTRQLARPAGMASDENQNTATLTAANRTERVTVDQVLSCILLCYNTTSRPAHKAAPLRDESTLAKHLGRQNTINAA